MKEIQNQTARSHVSTTKWTTLIFNQNAQCRAHTLLVWIKESVTILQSNLEMSIEKPSDLNILRIPPKEIIREMYKDYGHRCLMESYLKWWKIETTQLFIS